MQRGGREIRVRALDGVLINVGGFSRNAAHAPAISSRSRRRMQWTNANPGDTGEMIEVAMRLGAGVDCMEEAWWVVTSHGPERKPGRKALSRPTARSLPFMHHLDLSLPYSIMVDQLGERFCDEAGAYMEIGQRMYERQRETGRAVPSWVVMDSRQRKNYPGAPRRPGQIPKQWLDSGYWSRRTPSPNWPRKCGIDDAGLERTVERFNGFCRTGVDEDFGRGGRAPSTAAHGDPTIKPNPNLGAIEQAPFYAVRMYPGDVGTAGGVVTDEHARVLRGDGSVIRRPVRHRQLAPPP